ncbi:MAG: hypothetical protein WBD20_17240 [Pirellulaceae bacterium]
MNSTATSRFHDRVGFRSAITMVLVALSLPAVSLPSVIAQEARKSVETPPLLGALIDPTDATPARLKELRSNGTNTVVFTLAQTNGKAKEAIRTATANAKQADLAYAYWIEVARCPELADEYPEWMASLQTHDEWRRFFPDIPQPKASEVAKTYPWVPILSREPFKAQRERVESLLANLPPPKLIFLNDLQGAPSACGCGNSLCRWTSDYGKRRTTVPLDDDAAALFVESIERASPNAEVIPVWTTECEEHDGSADGLCAGVGCFNGICWKAYTRQLMPLAQTSKRIGVLALYKEFGRDIPHYGRDEASWVEFAIKTFQTMPPLRDGTSIPAARIVAVVQGWDVTAEEIRAQQTAATNAGANGHVIAYDKIDQSWSPKIVPWD